MRSPYRKGTQRQSSNYAGIVSRCGEHVLRGSKTKLVELYENLSRQALTDVEAENFRQHAEYYRRLSMGSA